MDESPKLSPHVRSVESFLSAPPVDAAGNVPELLRPLMDMQARLRRPDRQVTLLGAVKTGKSSLLNALLGARLAPVRVHRTLPTVTVVEYGPEPKASLMMHGRDSEEVPFDALRDVEWNVDELAGVEELHLTVPLPLLAHRAVLVDTPGLLESEVLDEIAYRELFAGDLVVLVLAADKILSTGERDLAAWANDLLHGNIVFVINRMDLIEAGDRDDVMEWARSALRDVGNDLVGRARLFVTSTATASASDVGDFREWLSGFLASELSERAAMVARLGILEYHLREVAAQVQAERTHAASREADARRHHLERVMTDRAAAHKALAQGRVRLQAAKERLPSLGDAFVARCLDAIRGNLSRYRDEDAVRAMFQTALDEYAGMVREQVAAALSGVPVTPAPFHLSGWIFRMRLDPKTDPARELGVTLGDALTRIIDGGRAGREAGGAIGGWIGKNVLGIDAEGETLRRVEAVARGVVGPVQEEAESYLGRLFGLLDEANARYMSWTMSSPDVDEAERDLRYWTALGTWCDGFLRVVRLATEEILSDSGGDGG